MFLSLIFAIFVAIFWSCGEIAFSKLSKNVDRHNVYFYQYITRSILYLLVVVIFNVFLFANFNHNHFLTFLPIITCDLFATYVANHAVYNGKLSVISPIMASYPIVDIMLGLILLKEKIGLLEIILSIIIAISIIVLATSQKKSKNSPHPIRGIIFAIIYMLLVAVSIYFEKSAYLDNFSVYHLYFYKGLVYLGAGALFLFIIGVSPTKIKKPNKMIILGAGITPIGNILNSFALQFGKMVIVTPISSMYSVLTAFLSRKVLKEKVSLRENICISTILLSTILLIIMGIV